MGHHDEHVHTIEEILAGKSENERQANQENNEAN
jgi:hypothetical protein